MRKLTYIFPGLLLILTIATISELVKASAHKELGFSQGHLKNPGTSFGNYKESSELDYKSTKAIVLDTVSFVEDGKKHYSIIYKNVNDEIWEIDNALRFWNIAGTRDSIQVFYKWERGLFKKSKLIFIDIKKFENE